MCDAESDLFAALSQQVGPISSEMVTWVWWCEYESRSVPRPVGVDLPREIAGLIGGTGGIRTPGPVKVVRFQGGCIRPLCHRSVPHAIPAVIRPVGTGTPTDPSR